MRMRTAVIEVMPPALRAGEFAVGHGEAVAGATEAAETTEPSWVVTARRTGSARGIDPRSGTVDPADEADGSPMSGPSGHGPRLLLVLLSLVTAVTACADDRSPLEVVTDRAVDLAAEEFDAEPGDIEVVRAQEVTWRNSALGCPEPDVVYAPALVDGYRVVLEVDGERIHYHADEPEEPFRCDDPEEPLEVRGSVASAGSGRIRTEPV